jgi:prepilin-type N-terminal cleavage/methylation domain-containing protein
MIMTNGATDLEEKRSHIIVHAAMKQKKRHRSSGFTLMEVLIAIVVLSFALLAMATLAGSIMGYNKFADHWTKATTLAEDKIEEFKNLDYYSIASSTSDEIVDTHYTRSWLVYQDEPDTDMLTVYVKVEFKWQNRDHDVELGTIIIK